MKRFVALMIALLLTMTMAIGFAEELTSAEKTAAKKTEYIGDWEFFYYERDNAYVVRFAFKDDNKNRLACPCTVEVRLVNSEGVEVYSIVKDLSMTEDFSTWTWNSALFSDRNGIYANLYIKPEEILTSKSPKGTMYLKVYLNGWWSFDEIEYEVDDLPMTESVLNLPSVPRTITEHRYSGDRKLKITDISYKFEKSYSDNMTIYVYITGEMIASDTTAASYAHIGWRLLDEEGYIIDSGTWLTDQLVTGDKFRAKEFRIYDVQPGTYTLELRDVT